MCARDAATPYDACVTLTERFLSALANEPARLSFGALPDLEARLATLIAAAAGEVHVDEDALLSALAERIPTDDGPLDPAATLASFHAADLALAIACAANDDAALRVFEQKLGPEIDRAIKKSPTLGLGVDEFRQIIREKLFVRGPDSLPRVASYSGRGPLVSWVRVTCARAVIDLSRQRDDKTTALSDDDLFTRVPDRQDPEVRLLRERYAPLLPAAFSSALAKLAPRQRNLLRQRYLHEIPVSKLATSYGVHRATAFGWIEDARAELLKGVRAALRAHEAQESLDGVLGVMGSELDLSLRRMLDSALEADG
jgi:RNA polymerase sigma-70 factor (ECF subfamily)